MSYSKLLKASGLRGPLLTPPANQPKIMKNEKRGYYTAALHLAPASLSGFNTCAGSSPGCRAACIHYAGNPLYLAAKTKARIARTKLYFEQRSLFFELLHLEIAAHARTAERFHLRPAVRLNATSDIDFVQSNVLMITQFSEVAFYDYTSVINRLARPGRPSNYHLTFSLKENNLPQAERAARLGFNVAVVFPTATLPATYTLGGLELPVINGDEHDFRPLDPKGCIVGLKAKGRGKLDETGFIQHLAA